MAGSRIVPLDQPGLKPLVISPRLRSQLVYFMKAAGEEGVPPLAEGEFFFSLTDTAQRLEDGVLYLVSPLDTVHMTEVELSEEQETLLQWLQDNRVQHVRVEEAAG